MQPLTAQNILLSNIKRLIGKSSDYHQVIGEVLKRRGIITEKQLQDALKIQKEKLYTLGKAVRLGQIIVELGYASEGELVEAVNAEYQITAKSLTDDIKGLVNEKRGSFIEGLPSPRIPIWLQLFAVTMIIIITTIFSLSFFVLSQQKEMLYQQTAKVGKVSLNYFSSNAPILLLEENVLRLNTLIKDATAVEGLLYAIIVDHNQIVKAHTDLTQIDTAFEKFDKTEDVKREVKMMYDLWGTQGGIILAPAHEIEPETPIENILAMYDALNECFV